MNDIPNKEPPIEPRPIERILQKNDINTTLEKESPSFRDDLKISWKIFSQNWRTYVSFSLFAFLGGILLLTILSFLLGILLIQIMVTLDRWDFIGSEGFFILMAVLINIPSSFLILGLFGSVWGLSNDIIASGDEFSEFKSAMTYFRRYWWQYVCLNLICGFINLIQTILFTPQLEILPITSTNRGFYLLLTIGGSFAGILLFYLFIMTFPSITAQGKFRRAFFENITILRENPLRIFKIILFYYISCSLPIICMNFLISFYLDFNSILNYLVFMLFFLIYSVIAISIMYPLLSLMLTRIYHTSPSQESWRIDRNQQDKVKLEPKF